MKKTYVNKTHKLIPGIATVIVEVMELHCTLEQTCKNVLEYQSYFLLLVAKIVIYIEMLLNFNNFSISMAA
jgi:hypothetical protein